MSRSLKYDFPGPDWRVAAEDLGGPDLVAVRARLEPPLPLVVDLGFGRGEFLLDLAGGEPQAAFVGVEYSFKRVLKMARRLARTPLRNVRLVCATAEAVVESRLPDGFVHAFWINFPDPWPKKRHQRRRLIQPAFVEQLARRLVPGGTLHVATDDAGLRRGDRRRCSRGEPLLENLHAPAAWRASLPARCATAYELEWRAEGRAARTSVIDGCGRPRRLTPLRAAHRVAPDPSRPELATPNLKDLPDRGAARAPRAGRPAPYRAEQIAGWLYRRGVEDPAAMTDLGRRAARAARGRVGDARARRGEGRALRRRHRRRRCCAARDGALHRVGADPRGGPHHAVRLDAGRLPARVLLLRHRRDRLHAQPARAEIVDQVCRMRELLARGPRASRNVVFMGMGEPLLNLDAVVRGDAAADAPEGLRAGTAPRHRLDGRHRAAHRASCSSACRSTSRSRCTPRTDAVRDVLVPLNRRFPLARAARRAARARRSSRRAARSSSSTR